MLRHIFGMPFFPLQSFLYRKYACSKIQALAINEAVSHFCDAIFAPQSSFFFFFHKTYIGNKFQTLAIK